MISRPGPVVIRLEDGPESADQVGPLLARAGIRLGQPVVVLVGGASGMSTADVATASALFDGALVPALRTTGAGLVDGGTNAGVMALAGSARSRASLGGTHIGVIAAGVIAAGALADVGGNDRSSDPVQLEQHHSHVLVVPGADWGDEAPWLSRVATVVSDGQPSVTLLVNGGDIAYQDMELSLEAGRPAIVIAGTGRTADDIAASPPATPRARALARSPLVRVIPATASGVLHALREALSGR